MRPSRAQSRTRGVAFGATTRTDASVASRLSIFASPTVPAPTTRHRRPSSFTNMGKRLIPSLRCVQSAFLFREARPAPCARIFPRLHLSRAVRAADTRIILLMQWVIGHVVFADVFPDVFPGPVRDRIHFYQAEFFIPFDFFRIRPSHGLIAANSGGPGGERSELGLERLDFTQFAALIRIDGPEFLAELRSLLFRGELRFYALDADAVFLFNFLDQFIRFRE